MTERHHDAPDWEIVGENVLLDQWNPFKVCKDLEYIAGFAKPRLRNVSARVGNDKKYNSTARPIHGLSRIPHHTDFDTYFFGRLQARGHINKDSGNTIVRGKRPVAVRNRYA